MWRSPTILGAEVSKGTTSKVTKGKSKVTTDDVGNVERSVGEKEPGSSSTPVTVGKATEPTEAVEGVSHTLASVLPAELLAAPPQQQSRSPYPHSNLHFNASANMFQCFRDMAEGGPSILVKRPIRVACKQAATMVDHPIENWNDNKKVMYKRDGVYMVLGGRVTQRL